MFIDTSHDSARGTRGGSRVRTWSRGALLSARVPLWPCSLIAIALLSGCGKSKSNEAAETEAPTPVQVDDVTRGPIDLMVTADAVLYPVNQANVTSKISEPVRRVLVNRGDHVKAGN